MTNDPFSFDRRLFLGMAGASALLPAVAASQPSGKGTPIIVNALGGLSDPNDSEDEENRESRRTLSDRVIADARASGLTAVNITMGFVAGEEEPFEQTVREIARWEARVRSRPDDLIKVLNVADIVRARRLDRIGIIYGFQNAAMMATDIDRVDVFADLGVRVFQLTYNRANHIGGGSMSPEGTGISPFGRQVIERLNARKVMVDLSHSGERTCLEAARISQAPVSINHTGCRALTDLPRNKTDEELRLVAERGGFVGIYFMPFLSPDSLATAEDVVAHIDHAVNVCGEDHVGIGTDGGTTAVDDMDAFRAKMREEVAERRAAGIGAAGENPDTLPFVEELSGPDQFRRLIALLEQRGYTQQRIDKIMGLNFIDYAGRIWG
jgi:membrane dipeptidase